MDLQVGIIKELIPDIFSLFPFANMLQRIFGKGHPRTIKVKLFQNLTSGSRREQFNCNSKECKHKMTLARKLLKMFFVLMF